MMRQGSDGLWLSGNQVEQKREIEIRGILFRLKYTTTERMKPKFMHFRLSSKDQRFGNKRELHSSKALANLKSGSQPTLHTLLYYFALSRNDLRTSPLCSLNAVICFCRYNLLCTVQQI